MAVSVVRWDTRFSDLTIEIARFCVVQSSRRSVQPVLRKHGGISPCTPLDLTALEHSKTLLPLSFDAYPPFQTLRGCRSSWAPTAGLPSSLLYPPVAASAYRPPCSASSSWETSLFRWRRQQQRCVLRVFGMPLPSRAPVMEQRLMRRRRLSRVDSWPRRPGGRAPSRNHLIPPYLHTPPREKAGTYKPTRRWFTFAAQESCMGYFWLFG